MKFNPDGIKEDVIPNLENGIKSADSVDIMAINNKLGEFDSSAKLYQVAKVLEDAIEKAYVLINKLDVSIQIFQKAEKDNMDTIESLFLENIKYSDIVFADESGKYGIDQGIFDEADYIAVRRVAEHCNMSYRTAAEYCMYLNSLGTCTHTAYTNMIIDLYKDDPIQFEKDFGYPLYYINSKGKIDTNGDVLMAEMFLYYNSVENGGQLFTKDKDGKNVIVEGAIVSAKTKEPTNDPYEKQRWLDEVRVEDTEISNYLKIRGASKDLNKVDEYSRGQFDKKDINQVKDYLKKVCKKKDTYVTCTMIAGKKDVVITDVKTGEKCAKKKFGHIVYVIDANDDGVFFSSNGIEYFMPYKELEDCTLYNFEVYEGKE